LFDVPLLRQPFEDWYCPNCGISERVEALPPDSSRYHTCPGLHMLTAPLVRANVYAKVEAEERADYLNGETQETGDNGKPYMAVRVTRDDGDDLMVNAPTARMRMS
jgi:hypothetical protein